MAFDADRSRQRLFSENVNSDNTMADRAAAYLDVATAALDEIKRLQKIEQIEYPNALDDVKNLSEQIEIWHLRRENELRQWNELSQLSKDQAKRIEELEAKNAESVKNFQSWLNTTDQREIEKRDQRIQELEAALKEVGDDL